MIKAPANFKGEIQDITKRTTWSAPAVPGRPPLALLQFVPH